MSLYIVNDVAVIVRSEMRGAVEEDIDILFQIHKDAYLEIVDKIWGWDDEMQSKMFRNSIVLENVQVIMVGDRPVGYVSVDHREDLVFIQSIAIISEYRSKGIGGRVIQDIIASANTSGIPVHLQVMKINEARELYKRMGFRLYEDTETHYKLKREPDIKGVS